MTPADVFFVVVAALIAGALLGYLIGCIAWAIASAQISRRKANDQKAYKNEDPGQHDSDPQASVDE